MLGLVILLFVPALLSVLFITMYKNKKNGKIMYERFNDFLLNHESEMENILLVMNNMNSELFKDFTKTGIKVYLIENKNNEIKVYAINNQQHKSMTLAQFEKIKFSFNDSDNKTFYSSNIDSSSVYYRFKLPYENYILWLNQKATINNNDYD